MFSVFPFVVESFCYGPEPLNSAVQGTIKLFHQFDLAGTPGFVNPWLQRSVHAQDAEPLLMCWGVATNYN